MSIGWVEEHGIVGYLYVYLGRGGRKGKYIK